MEISAKRRMIFVAARWTARVNGSSGLPVLLPAVTGLKAEDLLSHKRHSVVERTIAHQQHNTENVLVPPNKK